ncbi:MAG: peptide-methionine (S)-S-oxide reductase MsrA [Bacteroidia bacterium]
MNHQIKLIFCYSFMSASFISCAQNKVQEKATTTNKISDIKMNTSNLDTITLGGGCYWCVEAVYQQLRGVEKVVSGFSGGTVKNPSYREVCNGTTGHAEAANIIYDKTQVSFKDILEVFFTVHDPTTLNRQGGDVGTQYRSAIFYHNDEQKAIAEDIIKRLNESGAYSSPIVTEVTGFKEFYAAENYHQNYYNQNGSEPYCQMVIRPKVEKFKKVFHDKLK